MRKVWLLSGSSWEFVGLLEHPECPGIAPTVPRATLIGLIPYRTHRKQPSRSTLQGQLSGARRSGPITSPLFILFHVPNSLKGQRKWENFTDLTVLRHYKAVASAMSQAFTKRTTQPDAVMDCWQLGLKSDHLLYKCDLYISLASELNGSLFIRAS